MKAIIQRTNTHLTLVLPVMIFLSFFLINSSIVYFGDDFYFLSFKQYHFLEYFEHLFGFYCTDNGRFIIHLLVTFFLKIPPIFWKIINSLMLTGICILPAKILAKNKGIHQSLIQVTSFFLISSIEIMVTRQSIYWITGSLNYIYPCIMLLIYTYFLTKIEDDKYFFITVILAFLAAATMEQSTMMVLGLTILTFLSRFKSCKSLKDIKQILLDSKRLLILILITLIGTCTIFLAPGELSRFHSETGDINLLETLKANMQLLLTFYTRSYTILSFCLIFNLFSAIYTYQNEKKIPLRNAMIFVYSSNIVFYIVGIMLTGITIKMIKYAICIYILITFFTTIGYLNYKIYHQLISPLTIALILLLGSQLMMITTPTLGYRNFIFGIFSYLFIISVIISKVAVSGKHVIIINSFLLILGITLNMRTFLGYQKTKMVNDKNLEIIANSEETSKNEKQAITLYKYPNENYGWAMPYMSEFHNTYFKEYYRINSEIIWK